MHEKEKKWLPGKYQGLLKYNFEKVYMVHTNSLFSNFFSKLHNATRANKVLQHICIHAFKTYDFISV